MNEQKAREILGDAIKPDDSLHDGYNYIYWNKKYHGDEVELDGEYTTEELQAIAWWITNK